MTRTAPARFAPGRFSATRFGGGTDTTPPVINFAEAGAQVGDDVPVDLDVSEPATVYWTLTDGDDTLTPAEVVAGADGVDSGSFAYTVPDDYTAPLVDGLNDTDFYLHLAAVDAAGNVSVAVEKLGPLTIDTGVAVPKVALVEVYPRQSYNVAASVTSHDFGVINLPAGAYFVGIGTTHSSGGTSISSVTHDGVTIAVANDGGGEPASASNGGLCLAWGGVLETAEANGNLIVNFAGATTLTSPSLWIVRIDNYNGIKDTKNHALTSAAATTETLDIDLDGAAIALSQGLADRTTTWTGLDEIFDGNGTIVGSDISGAFSDEMAAETGRVITATYGGGTHSRAAAVFVSLAANT
jgi:hypothetical protein